MSLELVSMYTMLQVRSAVFLVVTNYKSRICITWTCIQHRNRLFYLLWMWHGIDLDQISYYNTYSTLLPCGFLCGPQMAIMETGFITKYINVFMGNISILLYMIIPFYPLSFTCLCFFLINHPIFACRIR